MVIYNQSCQVSMMATHISLTWKKIWIKLSSPESELYDKSLSEWELFVLVCSIWREVRFDFVQRKKQKKSYLNVFIENNSYNVSKWWYIDCFDFIEWCSTDFFII